MPFNLNFLQFQSRRDWPVQRIRGVGDGTGNIRRADSVFQSYLTWAAANNEPLVTIQKFGLGQWWWSLSRSILGIRSMPCAPEK